MVGTIERTADLSECLIAINPRMGVSMSPIMLALKKVRESLDKSGVKYALAGKFGVNYYLVPTATDDIDIVICSNADMNKVGMALESNDFEHAGGGTIKSLQNAGNYLFIGPGSYDVKVDVIVGHTPLFEYIVNNSVYDKLSGMQIIPMEALIVMKKISYTSDDRIKTKARKDRLDYIDLIETGRSDIGILENLSNTVGLWFEIGDDVRRIQKGLDIN